MVQRLEWLELNASLQQCLAQRVLGKNDVRGFRAAEIRNPAVSNMDAERRGLCTTISLDMLPLAEPRTTETFAVTASGLQSPAVALKGEPI